MTSLSLRSIDNGSLQSIGITVPGFDIRKVCDDTSAAPVWLHFGAGNIFRAFIARLDQRLLNEGLSTTGIIAADTFDGELIEKIYKPFDNLSVMADLKPDGNIAFEVIGSITEAINVSSKDKDAAERLFAIASASSLQMISFTLTEKGYALRRMDGSLQPVVEADIKNGPDGCRHAMSIVCSLLLKRYEAGKTPLALVSMDNCSHNGEKLRNSVLEIATEWMKNGHVPSGFVDWISDEKNVSFPWSMIDKITPRPDSSVEAKLTGIGLEDMAPITTSKGTYTAPFVNAEIPEYLVVEDNFPNGRPALEKAGVYMTDRDTVNAVERMKVTTCLNPLHTSLAVFGCLLGFTKISDEMADPDLSTLVRKLGYDEALKVVTHPGIIDPKAFIDEVVNERLPNPYIPDMPQRIATDTSLKIPIRFGETIKAYVASDTLSVKDLVYVPLTIAGWIRYLLGKDDTGNDMKLSDDPQLESLQELLKDLVWNDPSSINGNVDKLLSNDIIFGTDLVKCDLAPSVKAMLGELMSGEGSVRRTLQKYTGTRIS